MVMPNVITPRSVDNIAEDIRTSLPDLRVTDPIHISSQNMAGYIFLWEVDLNNRLLGIFIDHSTGTTLDNIGSEYTTPRNPNEDDDTYRIRIKNTINAAGSAGTTEAYLSAATEHEMVQSAAIFPNTTDQFVDIYINTARGNASPALVAEVQADLDVHPKKAVLDRLRVMAADNTSITIVVNIVYPRGTLETTAQSDFVTNSTRLESLARVPGRVLSLNEVVSTLSTGGYAPAVTRFSLTTGTGVQARLNHSGVTPPQSEAYTITFTTTYTEEE